MFVVHWGNWGPRVSGMYESIKDQVKYENRAGIRSEMALHFEDYKPDEHNDNGFMPILWSVAAGADVWIMHSGFPESLKDIAKKKVRVAVLHGPTEHMFFKEWNNTSTSFNLHVNLVWEMDATVCLNVHEYDIMKLYDEKKGRCRYIPNSIDLERTDGVVPWKYEKHPAIISCDTPRVEKLPMHIIWAIPKIAEKIPTARLNLFSLLLEPISIYRNVFCRSHDRRLEHLCENIQLANKNLLPFQAGADIGFNNNYSGIASRVTMEMMAFGVPVISYSGDYTKYHAKAFDLDSIAEQVERCWKDLTAEGSTLREDTKKYARENFDRAKYVPQYIELYKELLEKRQG